MVIAYGCLIEELDGYADCARHFVWFVQLRGTLLAVADYGRWCSLFVSFLGKVREESARARQLYANRRAGRRE
jgi:hypothetical protein